METPEKFDPRDYMKPARDAMKKVVAQRMVQFGQAGHAKDYKPIPLEEMAKRYAPARAAGNAMAGPRQSAVEDLIAEGPGTLSPAAKQQSSGAGKRTATGWTVMLVRPLPAPMAGGKRSQVAFAVWDGAHGEVGARKMRSVWVPISLEGKP